MQRIFIKKTIKPVLAHAGSLNDGSLDKTDFDKINNYYGLAVPAILGEAFCMLHGKKMSSVERTAATAQGAMTGLFDDFFDKEYLSDTNIERLLREDESAGKRSNEKLFLLFYKTALHNVPDKKGMILALTQVYHAQRESKKQTGMIDEAEILNITFNKGGTSLLFYRSAFAPEATVAEKKLLYDLGALMQLSNDIFDVYKDREHGINTLVTGAKHIHILRDVFEQKLVKCYQSAYGSGFKKASVF